MKREFKHLALDIQKVPDANQLKVDLWFGNRETIAAIRWAIAYINLKYNCIFIMIFFYRPSRTVCSHIENMITGVTRGFKYKMRFCYAHFPINVAATGNVVEIRNFLGEKKVRRVKLLDGVKYVRNSEIKDQIELSGIDVTAVSLSCAQIHQATMVKNKDIRKFLDGIYVSEKGFADE